MAQFSAMLSFASKHKKGLSLSVLLMIGGCFKLIAEN